MLHISSHVNIPDSEIDIHAMRSQGAGGQNVNKVESKVQLRFDVNNSLILSEEEKLTLLQKLSPQNRSH